MYPREDLFRHLVVLCCSLASVEDCSLSMHYSKGMIAPISPFNSSEIVTLSVQIKPYNKGTDVLWGHWTVHYCAFGIVSNHVLIFLHFSCHGSVKASQHQPHVIIPHSGDSQIYCSFQPGPTPACITLTLYTEAWYQRVSLSVIWRNLSAIDTFFQLEDRDVQFDTFDTFSFSLTLLRLESWATVIISNKSLITNLLCFTFGIYQIKTTMWQSLWYFINCRGNSHCAETGWHKVVT